MKLQLWDMAAVRATFLIATIATIGFFSPSSDPAIVVPNDNRAPAGVLKNDTLTIDLVVKMARWYPEAENGRFADVAAFAEKGKEPRIPGPLIRVPEGTTIIASITNELADSAIWVHGLMARPATSDDSTRIQPGQSRTFKFAAGKAGTYYYYATPGSVFRTAPVFREREQLSGAFIVDEPGARTDDRIMVINIWGEPPAPGRYSNAVAINGKSWPYTERLSENLGDSVHWRVINASVRNHPMHLHGFYFHLTSRGSILADTILRGDRREFVVTKHMVPGSTMSMSWLPNRPGNWLFHCHFTAHVDERARLGFVAPTTDMHMGDADPMKHMAGLVMGITVSDSAHRYHAERPILPLRKLHIYAQDRPAAPGRLLATSYILQRDGKPPAPDSIERAGQPIVLTRNQPTRITIVNRAHAGTSIHWHGIELESYSDGVAGWSGVSTSLAPMIAPNDSFTANLILPRKGTFIYHTHVNDLEQLTSGAYGPIVVLDAGEQFDPSTDHTITLGWLGTTGLPNVKLALNGDSLPPPLVLNRYLAHRFRIVNIGPGARWNVTLLKDSTVMTWHPLAKDGFELTQFAQTMRPASQLVSVGETFDAEWKPRQKGNYVMTFANGGKIYNRLKLIVK